MSKIRTEQLTIYLLKNGIETGIDAIKENGTFEDLGQPYGSPQGSRLLIREKDPTPPNWLKFFPRSIQKDAIHRLRTSSAGALLLVPASDRWFAVCFGTGWHLLKKDSFVRSFGLRTALSVIKEKTLKSVDVSTYENFAKHRRVSTSKGTSIDSFDIEGHLDLLRGVVGECGFRAIGQQIAGKDACVVWTRVSFECIHKLCRVLLSLYESSRVAERYPLINNVSEVRDPSVISRLDGLLDTKLAEVINYDVTIAPPEAVSWQEIQSFKFDQYGSLEPSLGYSFDDVREMFGAAEPTCELMRKITLETVKPDGNIGLQSWSLYDCLVTEINDTTNSNYKYILMAGEWYEVAESFAQQVETGIAALSMHSIVLPNAGHNENEGEYNLRFVSTDTSIYTLLDKKNISYGGGSSRVEVCDVLSSTMTLYHVKDYHGSATLSHLFAQGTVSARLLLEQEFRQKLLTKYPDLPANVLQVGRISPGDIEIVYAIICESGRELPSGLPFFSKVRLLESVRELRRMGYSNVSVAKITRADGLVT